MSLWHGWVAELRSRRATTYAAFQRRQERLEASADAQTLIWRSPAPLLYPYAAPPSEFRRHAAEVNEDIPQGPHLSFPFPSSGGGGGVITQKRALLSEDLGPLNA